MQQDTSAMASEMNTHILQFLVAYDVQPHVKQANEGVAVFA